mmetsp:Transcript_20516/g.26552  ORF Transcript_20516/g.26552 Transcript_20516/m.26552 type:complete len:442 (+) Transcript_20516:152-1477(+)
MDPSAYSSTPPFLEGSSFGNLMTSEQMQELSGESFQSGNYQEQQYTENQTGQNFMAENNMMNEQYMEQSGQNFSSEGMMQTSEQNYLSTPALSEQQYLGGSAAEEQDASMSSQNLQMQQNYMGQEGTGTTQSYSAGANLSMDQPHLGGAAPESSYYGNESMDQQYHMSGAYGADHSQMGGTDVEHYQHYGQPGATHMEMASSLHDSAEYHQQVNSNILSAMHHHVTSAGHDMPAPPMHLAPHLPKPSILEVRKRAFDDIPGLKKPPSPWMLFVEDIREDLQHVVPNGSTQAQQHYISQRWLELSPEQKQKYRDAAREEHLRYQREVRAWKRERGLDPEAPIPQEILLEYQQQAMTAKEIPIKEIITPAETVEKIIKLDPEVREITKEGISCITKAMELFVAKMASDCGSQVRRTRAPLQHSDVHEMIRQKEYLLFLREDFS